MKIKLTPIALLATAVTALYWKRRAIQAENRLTARVLAEEKERAEREKKPDGFWDLLFSDEQSATKPDLSEVLQSLKEANSQGWARTVSADDRDQKAIYKGKSES